ncbi:MAG: 2-hydroxyacid dehydrogenase [Clostridia bacterium]|nr:2-hydroxyacid dehydrogenase [Clostridia bacterium]
MKILFFDTKPYDREAFDSTLGEFENVEITYLDAEINPQTARLAKGYDAVCLFVAADVCENTLAALGECGVKLVLMRCAGFNNVNMDAAKKFGITVMRVPSYSPEAISEHALALAFAVNRHIHKAYIKVRENNFSLMGLTGMNFYGKTAGIIGTGKIGASMCRACHGLGMKVIAYDKYPNPSLDFVTYLPLDEVLSKSDLISLHCPLTDETYHMIDFSAIEKMKDNVILINTSRGALIDTNDLIRGIRAHKFAGVGLDVYEEEGDFVFENLEDDILSSSVTARLLSFPNVIVTSHQGFFTKEALAAISRTTLENAVSFERGAPIKENIVI